jgi:hypothetical protein
MPKGKSATQRSLQLLRKEGWQCQVVERWQAFARKRIDLFGCIDILAVKPGLILGVQATTSSVSAHATKALNCGGLRGWLEAGPNVYFEIWGWTKKGKRGQRKTYQLRRCPIQLNLDRTPLVFTTPAESPWVFP